MPSSYLGPLTTTFTPPHSCLENLFNSSIWTFLGDRARSECFPSGYSAGFYSSGYYAPGVCPSGYSTGCASVNSQQMYEGLCCPKSWTCEGRINDGWFRGPVAQIQSGLCGSTTTETVTWSVSNSKSTTSYLATLFAWGIRVQAQDPRSTAPVNTSTNAAPGGSVTADLAHETDTAATPASTQKTSSGLTVGAQIAIGVTIPVVLCVLAAVFILIWRRRRRRRSNTAHETTATVPPAELRGLPLHHELPAVPPYHELDSLQKTPSEMAGDSPIEVRPAVVRKPVGTPALGSSKS